MMFRLFIKSLDDTRRIGRALASCIERENPTAMLFYGQMGAGKTTIIRAIVEGLPGGHEAEVSSPSFTISNIYETIPEIRHFDLYRLEENCVDESLLESFDEPGVLTFVEWPERLRANCLPSDGLEIRLGPPVENTGLDADSIIDGSDQCRDIAIIPLGEKGARALRAFQMGIGPG